jgi:glucose 1-dehydrogenase
MEKSLNRKTALVTGASSGIGQAIAIHLAALGANVIINFHSDEIGANGTLDQIRKENGSAVLNKADVSDEDEVIRMFQDTIKLFGTLDILVNNSGIQDDSKISEMSLEKWNNVLGVNLTGYFLCSREAIKIFLKNSFPKDKFVSRGKIIFISSVHEKIPWAGHANYAASKGGIDMLMKTIAMEMAPEKIRVNSVAPGAIRTHINTEAWNTPNAMEELLRLIPYNRIGDPADVAKVVGWLASDESDYVTGTTIFVDGGMTLYPAFAHGG